MTAEIPVGVSKRVKTGGRVKGGPFKKPQPEAVLPGSLYEKVVFWVAENMDREKLQKPPCEAAKSWLFRLRESPALQAAFFSKDYTRALEKAAARDEASQAIEELEINSDLHDPHIASRTAAIEQFAADAVARNSTQGSAGESEVSQKTA